MEPPMMTGWPVSLYLSGIPSMPGPKALVEPLRWTSRRVILPFILWSSSLAVLWVTS